MTRHVNLAPLGDAEMNVMTPVVVGTRMVMGLRMVAGMVSVMVVVGMMVVVVAGRAGREAPGKCFRLYLKNSYE